MSEATDAHTARLFVAVDPPAEVCEELAAWARSAMRGPGAIGGKTSSVRVLGPGAAARDAVLSRRAPGGGDRERRGGAGGVREAQVGELAIGAPLWLPPRRPRALAVEVRDDADGGLAALHEALVQALARACGYEEERRRFRAHVTLARMREGSPWVARAERVLPPTPALSFTPASIVLYRSWLSPAGASYEALARTHARPVIAARPLVRNIASTRMPEGAQPSSSPPASLGSGSQMRVEPSPETTGAEAFLTVRFAAVRRRRRSRLRRESRRRLSEQLVPGDLPVVPGRRGCLDFALGGDVAAAASRVCGGFRFSLWCLWPLEGEQAWEPCLACVRGAGGLVGLSAGTVRSERGPCARARGLCACVCWT